MNSQDVMSCKNFKKEGVIAVAETMSGDRFIVKQISFNRDILDAEVKFTNGVTSKSDALKRIEKFNDIKDVQKFLINKP